jgi:hypothetical protein
MALRDWSLTSVPPGGFRIGNASMSLLCSKPTRGVLFKRVEVAEAAILTRRDALEHDSSSQTGRAAIEDALANLRVLKRDRLHFGEAEK